MPRYRKPPIVEAWLAFDFAPRPDKRTWESGVVPFRRMVKEDFPEAKYHFTTEIQVAESESGEIPVVTDHKRKLDVVRMWSKDGKSILQLANDRLAANTLQAGSQYQGFRKLRKDAFERLGAYNEVYQPTAIRETTIHLTDIIEIPFSDPAPEAEELFTIVRNIPVDPFGNTSDLLIQFSTIAPHDGQPLSIQLGRVPSGKPKFLRFRMDWEKSASVNCRLDDPSSLESVLNKDYEFLVRCFEMSVTKSTLNLFEPLADC